MRRSLLMLIGLVVAHVASSQNFNQIDEGGNVTTSTSRNFNPHNNDTTNHNKVVPKGIYAWTVDRKFGDIKRVDVDTLPHLYPQSTLATGRYGQFNTLGSNYTARQNRIFIDREETSQFAFTDAYDQALRRPDQWHFTNTLSPITNLSYDNCGDKTTGEDHLDARFAVNAGKQTGLGFDLDYLYARGYFQNQSTSHFGATFYVSHLGDRYQIHALYTTHHEKAALNGGITNDNYITHPELYSESYSENEIPVYLNSNWNRDHSNRLFVTHRYALGFYRQVPLTEEEVKAREFVKDSLATATVPTGTPNSTGTASTPMPSDSLNSTMAAAADSLQTDSLPKGNMKSEFVPVTSFIHTLEGGIQQHTYHAYASPTDYYANTYYNIGTRGYSGDSIFDRTKLTDLKNTLAIALLEGFNRYVPAGLKVFATHELRRFNMPDAMSDGTIYMGRWTEHNVSLGGQLVRTQGHLLHYNLAGEAWVVGEDAGQLKLNGSTDLNFPLLGDTVRLAARAYFYRLAPTFLQRHYHSKHLWWDQDLDKETRTRIEGTFTYEKTNTSLRVAVEEIQNYTYLGMSYTAANETRQQFAAGFRQHSGNINILTAQLDQKLTLGPLHWDNLITYQSTSNEDVLPLPTLNVFSNLYLKFRIAQVLTVELGGSATWFTKYYAPDYCPLLNQYAVQQNNDVRMQLGNFPFVDVYANLHLKHARFFLMMSNATGTSFNRQSFMTPHYPLNRSTLHFGISWNFFN